MDEINKINEVEINTSDILVCPTENHMFIEMMSQLMNK
jgi:hypothetical protein